MRSPFVALGALALVLVGAGPAAAEPPVSVTDRVTDEVDALGNEQAVQAAIDELSADSDIDLYAVFVSSFDTADTEWIEQTARLSRLEGSDVLLAVAVADGTYEYGWWVDESFPLAEVDVEDVIATQSVPEFESGNWDAGVVTLAEQLRSMSVPVEEQVRTEAVPTDAVQTPSWSATTTMLVVGGLAVVLIGAHLFSRRRTPASPSR